MKRLFISSMVAFAASYAVYAVDYEYAYTVNISQIIDANGDLKGNASIKRVDIFIDVFDRATGAMHRRKTALDSDGGTVIATWGNDRIVVYGSQNIVEPNNYNQGPNNVLHILQYATGPWSLDPPDSPEPSIVPPIYSIPNPPTIGPTDYTSPSFPETITLPNNPPYNPNPPPVPEAPATPVPHLPPVPDLPSVPPTLNPPSIVPPESNPPDSQLPDQSGGESAGGGDGYVNIEGMNDAVYNRLKQDAYDAGYAALQQRHLSSEEIALRIHDVLMNLGLSGDSFEVNVQEALDAQGISDYKISLAVTDALENQGLNVVDLSQGTEWALSKRNLSAEQIAFEIKLALESLGLDTSGMQNSLTAALQNQDLSAGNMQMSFETALQNTAADGEGMARAFENSLANRNLSGAEIGQEVGNQISGLDLATGTDVGEQTDLIVSALGDVQTAVENSSGTDPDDILAGTYSDGIAFGDQSEFQGALDANKQEIEGIDWSSVLSGAAARFKAVLYRVFTISLPDVGQSRSITFELPSFMGVGLPPLHIDLDNLVYVDLLRHCLVIALAIWGIRQCMTIFNTTFQ